MGRSCPDFPHEEPTRGRATGPSARVAGRLGAEAGPSLEGSSMPTKPAPNPCGWGLSRWESPKNFTPWSSWHRKAPARVEEAGFGLPEKPGCDRRARPTPRWARGAEPRRNVSGRSQQLEAISEQPMRSEGRAARCSRSRRRLSANERRRGDSWGWIYCKAKKKRRRLGGVRLLG